MKCVLSTFDEDYFCQFIGTCRFPILFHWSVCLFLCQYRIFINSSYPQGISMLLCVSLKLSM